MKKHVAILLIILAIVIIIMMCVLTKMLLHWSAQERRRNSIIPVVRTIIRQRVLANQIRQNIEETKELEMTVILGPPNLGSMLVINLKIFNLRFITIFPH